MTDIIERVAVLEQKVSELIADQSEILVQLREINGNLSKYKGFVGGVAFVFSAVVTFLTIAKDWVLAHLK